jgi:membrane protease YdiL (CAAX protease family)
MRDVYRPVRFFVLTYLVTWVSWFAAAFLSHHSSGQGYVLLLLPGLVAPFVIALWMTIRSGSPVLQRQFVRRVFDPRLIRPVLLIPTFIVMPAAVALSIVLSELVGQPHTQFQLADGFSFSAGAVPVLLVLVLAASFEELGWRTYAVDALATRLTYFRATCVFAVLWAGWHLPLFFIKDYYQYEITQQNVWFGVNFMLSVIPMAFIIGWLCRANRGSVPAAIGFHFVVNQCQEAWQVTQVTKCIETGVLCVVAATVVLLNRQMFFGSGPSMTTDDAPAEAATIDMISPMEMAR